MDDKEWESIIRLQREVKELILLSEENGFEWKTFIQPLLEERSALDHICRAKGAELGLHHSDDKNYYTVNLDKVKGHLYRAFFDVADWFSITIREKLQVLLSPYDNESISAVIPDYYSTIRPKVEAINQEIARLRFAKDVSVEDGKLINEIDEYKDKIKFLLDTHNKLVSCVPALEEYKSKHENAKLVEKTWDIIKIILAAFLGAIIGYYIKGGKQG